MKRWINIVGFLMIVCSMMSSEARAAAPVPRSDGCVWNIDFESYIDNAVGFLNAGVRYLGNGGPVGNQPYAMVTVSKDLAFGGDRCAHIVAREPNSLASIGLQKRFDVPAVENEVIEFVFRPTVGDPVDLHQFVVWGSAGIILYANGTASEGTYHLGVQSGKNAVTGLKQAEWIRVVMVRSKADKKVSLWVGPPDKEQLIGKFSDADPNRRIGSAALGLYGSSGVRGEGYWDDIRVGKRLLPNGQLAPGESVRDVSQELLKIKYPIEVGREKQLFVDDVMIESMTGIKRTLIPLSKHRQNPLLQAEQPWEVKCQYFLPYVVLREEPGKPFRTWYGCYIRGPGGQMTKQTFVCLAESDDGLKWTRRNVNRYTPDGATENAAVWDGRAFRPIFDPRDPDPSRRYKGMTRVAGFTPIFSPDGVEWTIASQIAINQAFDATSFHWDSVGEKWIASVKTFHNGKRTRGYAESANFVNWTDTYPMLETDQQDGPKDQTYSMRIFRYESIYVGLIKIYHLDTDQCDMQLAFSRNAKHWERPDRTIFLANAKEEGGYDHGNIDEAGDPIAVGDQLWFYYSGRHTLHEEKSGKADGSLCLSTLRLDGFMPVDAGNEEGTLVTKPLKLTGNSLWVNADAKGGEIRVEIVDSDSLQPIGVFARDNCGPLTEDNVRQKLTWRGDSSKDLPQDKPVRLRFRLRNAKLYSFWTEASS